MTRAELKRQAKESSKRKMGRTAIAMILVYELNTKQEFL